MALRFKQDKNGIWQPYRTEQQEKSVAPDSSDTKSVARRKKSQKEEVADEED